MVRERHNGRPDGRYNRRDSSDKRSFGRSRKDSSKFREDRRGSKRDRPEMHSVTCDKCHKRCEVPFAPSGDKPVYCSDCFSKTDSRSGSSRNAGSRSGDFEIINHKLDKIMKALDI
jgi:CxxC-x17-CxxC domain-containing protein